MKPLAGVSFKLELYLAFTTTFVTSLSEVTCEGRKFLFIVLIYIANSVISR